MGLKLIFLIVSRAVSLFGLSRRESWWKDAEILMLRHQLAVTQREPPRAYSRLAWPDLAWLALLAGTLPVERLAAMRLIVTPGIILRWHRDIVRRQWGRRSRQGRSGRPATHRKVRSVVLRLARESESWGYRRIHPRVRPGETACIPSPAADRGADGWVLVPMSPEQPPSTVVERPVSGPRSEEKMMPADVLAASTMRFATDPDQARSAPAVTASLVNGHARLSAGPFNWDADLPTAIGGRTLRPAPPHTCLARWQAVRWRSSTTRSRRNSARGSMT